jgi:hypothetical protein
MTEELLYAREYARSQAIAIWNVHYNYHRPRSAAGGQPPASRLKTRVTTVRPSYTQQSTCKIKPSAVVTSGCACSSAVLYSPHVSHSRRMKRILSAGSLAGAMPIHRLALSRQHAWSVGQAWIRRRRHRR